MASFVASPTTLPGLVFAAPAFSQGQPGLSTAFAAGGAEVMALCSDTVKFLLAGLLWDVIKMFQLGHRESFMGAHS